MGKLKQNEVLQPSLLDRLTDDEPDKKLESRDNRVFSFPKLRNAVLRDLSWLLNAICLETQHQELRNFPEVRKSVVNYGIRNLAGSTLGATSHAELRRFIEEAVLNFEPRIIPQTLRVHVFDKERRSPAFQSGAYDEHRYPNTMLLKIEGDLWAHPIPERLYLKTVLDLELGNIRVSVER